MVTTTVDLHQLVDQLRTAVLRRCQLPCCDGIITRRGALREHKVGVAVAFSSHCPLGARAFLVSLRWLWGRIPLSQPILHVTSGLVQFPLAPLHGLLGLRLDQRRSFRRILPKNARLHQARKGSVTEALHHLSHRVHSFSAQLIIALGTFTVPVELCPQLFVGCLALFVEPIPIALAKLEQALSLVGAVGNLDVVMVQDEAVLEPLE
mmetsp:Transcript_14036/g.30465  ORF Transcript_14036/g.30465 Transcript_14036/m.30465 type:complete len:207 (+) Transcript_14036:769-1389(+)